MTHFSMTHMDLVKQDGAGGQEGAGKHARDGHVAHHAANSLPTAHIMLFSLAAAVVLAAVLLVAFT